MTSDPKPLNKQRREPREGRSQNWRDLARSTANEKDPARVLERAQELIRALDVEAQKGMEPSATEKRTHKAAS